MSSTEPSSITVFLATVFGRLNTRPYECYVDSFGLTGDEWVLDYGSGGGRLSQPIAERLSHGTGHLTCVDVSTVWMGVVTKRLQGYSNVDFKLGDVASLDISDEAYGVVVVHFVLHHVDKPVRQEKVDALARKLKQGGRLFIREPTRAGHGTPVDEIRTLLSAAGLRERDSTMTRSLMMGHVYEGVFEKAS
ncbi:MAG: class I SAM-dependent methyltransferase [Halobacteriota archaeon]